MEVKTYLFTFDHFEHKYTGKICNCICHGAAILSAWSILGKPGGNRLLSVSVEIDCLAFGCLSLVERMIG